MYLINGFISNTLYNKEKVFYAFEDMKKAFDTVFRDYGLNF